MRIMRIVIEVEVPENFDRKEFNDQVLVNAKSQYGSLIFVSTEPVVTAATLYRAMSPS